MIYLIGGAPRCGKTTIAKKLSQKLHIPWISADTIESMVIVSTPVRGFKKLFPKSILRKKTRQSNDILYGKYSAREITKAYITQSKSSWKAIAAMVECEIKSGFDYIIEGHQIHPQLIARIIKKYGGDISPLIVTRFDVTGIVNGCLKHRAKDDWFIQKTKKKETFNKIAEMLVRYSYFFNAEAKKYGLPIVTVDGDFIGQLNTAVKTLGKK